VNAKALIMIGLVTGSALGGYVPALWGAGGITLTSVLFSGVGGLLGIWAGYKISRLGT
jgi:predicted MFS family arabinose efflux permease